MKSLLFFVAVVDTCRVWNVLIFFLLKWITYLHNAFCIYEQNIISTCHYQTTFIFTFLLIVNLWSLPHPPNLTPRSCRQKPTCYWDGIRTQNFRVEYISWCVMAEWSAVWTQVLMVELSECGFESRSWHCVLEQGTRPLLLLFTQMYKCANLSISWLYALQGVEKDRGMF